MENFVIVTGGAGYIGSHACKALNKIGFVPVTVDNLSTGWSDAVQYGPLENVDLLDIQKLDGVFAKYRPKAVMHFAAYSQVAESFLDPLKYWRNNFGLTKFIWYVLLTDAIMLFFSTVNL